MNKFLKLSAIAATVVTLTACGQRVEVPPASVGKVMTSVGYKEGVIDTSRFRLDVCLPGQACERLVVFNASDLSVREPMTLMMPVDKLNMNFVLQATLTVNPKKYDEVFSRVRPKEQEGDTTLVIERIDVYNTYARQIILTEAREFLSKYSIEQIMSNLEVVNAELNKNLTRSISEKTPFVPRFIGLSDVQPPSIIVEAQEAAAKRREQIAQEEAQLEVSKVQIARELQEQKARRAVEVEKANSEAEVNRILAASMTPGYIKYRELGVLSEIANSDNKVFVPVGALNTIAVQNQIGK